MTDKPVKLANWKSELKNGQIIPINGFEFIIVNIGRRGISLRKFNPKKQVDQAQS